MDALTTVVLDRELKATGGAGCVMGHANGAQVVRSV